jgi:hypothetical protein
MKQRKPRFDVVLTESVVEGLNSISPSIHSVTLFYLKKNKSIPLDGYIADAKAIDEGLKEIFGFGAKVIEKKILEFLYLKLEVPLRIRDDFDFTDEVKRAQKLLGSADLIPIHAHH